MTNTDEPQPSEYDIHDPTLEGIERECVYDMPMKSQVDELVIEGAST